MEEKYTGSPEVFEPVSSALLDEAHAEWCPAIGADAGAREEARAPDDSEEARAEDHSSAAFDASPAPSALEESYDAIPYDGGCFEQSHPARLAVVARLFGLPAPPVETARVLELGCAGGQNLIPMAAHLPHATFLGTDLSSRQINDGLKLVEALKLRNIRLERIDILDMGEDIGTFDYIVCHGVYSWVPDPVRSKILEIIRRHLAPDGIAYISYNVYPGWYQHQAVRELMLFAAKDASDPVQRLSLAKDVLGLVDPGTPGAGSPHGTGLKAVRDALIEHPDSYTQHEYLEPFNRPFWFYEFWSHLAEKALTYVADSNLGNALPPDVPETVLWKFKALATDRLRLEQYSDVIQNRKFRQSIVAQAGQVPSADIRVDVIESLLVSGEFDLATGAEPDIGTPATMVFLNSRGQELTTDDPMAKAVLWELGSVFPGMIATPSLRHRAASRVPATLADSFSAERPELGLMILQLASERSVDLHVSPLPVAVEVGERPEASAIARHLASIGPDVPNLRHRQIVLSEFEREVLVLLDGKHTLHEVSTTIQGGLRRGVFSISRDGVRVDYQTLHPMIPRLVASVLQVFLRQSLLVAPANPP